MMDASQLATAAIAVAFAAMLLVTGHWFVDSQLQRDIGVIAATAAIFP